MITPGSERVNAEPECRDCKFVLNIGDIDFYKCRVRFYYTKPDVEPQYLDSFCGISEDIIKFIKTISNKRNI